VERNHDYDDEKAQNGGISLKYKPLFDLIPELKPQVLLEIVFAKTTPNEPKDVSSWAYDRILQTEINCIDNRAIAVKCFTPEYTFVDKLQTICRKYRQFIDRNDLQKDRPRQFLRHYYDLYMLLKVERVKKFINTSEYEMYKKEKIRGLDAQVFTDRDAFKLNDKSVYLLYEKEFESLNSLIFTAAPTFRELIEEIRSSSDSF
jgi:hypothetical protein